jgi:hypothetical protein
MSEIIPPDAPKERNTNALTGRKYAPLPPGKASNSPKHKKSTLDRLEKNPTAELVRIANALRILSETTVSSESTFSLEGQRKALESEMKIWMELLQYKEPKKRAVTGPLVPKTPQGSKKAAEATLDLMKELEKDFEDDAGTERKGDISGVETGKADLQAETGATEDLQDDKGQ